VSHYAIAKIKITNPHRQTFLNALQILAQKLGGRVAENVVVRGFDFAKKCDYAILVNLPYGNGYGIELTNDGIKVHVDDHGAPMTAQEFAEELMKTYTSLAITEALNELGYSVERQEEKDKVVLYAYEGW